MKCRHCAHPLVERLVDLGSAPPSNAYLTEATLRGPEQWYPLSVLICTYCWLAQTEDFADADELFGADYAYFSGFSTSWLEHCERYAADMRSRFDLDERSLVVEVAANDGSLLGFFHDGGIRSLGIEPTASTAAAARARGLEVVEEFFGVALAERLVARGLRANLTAANNVLAHVPDINDFVAGFAVLLSDDGVATFEFPHLLNLVRGVQFDTIYHEHLSYLSLRVVRRLFARHGLHVFDVEALPTHGGSLRVHACPAGAGQAETAAVAATMEREAALDSPDTYRRFADQVVAAKCSLLGFLLRARAEGKRVAGYGAPAKGNTLLNYCGVGPELLPFTADRSPHKQGTLLPGSRIPVRPPEALLRARPDYVLILPWNIADEVMADMAAVRDWGGQFVVPIPLTHVLP